MSEHDPDTIYTNCTIITNNAAAPRAQAMLVRGNCISAIGSIVDVQRIAGPGTRTVDLAQSTVVPGFDDCHMHILSLGLMLAMANVSAKEAASIENIVDTSRQHAAAAAGEWILGRGYNQNLLPEARHPNRFDLDRVSRERPVTLWHTSGHAVAVNSRALQVAGISASTPDPPGGQIDRDEHGQPTGVLKETAITLVTDMIPEPSASDVTVAILAASRRLASEGVTSASDAATGQHCGFEKELAAYRAASASPDMATRVILMPLISTVVADVQRDQGHSLGPIHFDCGRLPERLKVGPAKIFADGALTTRTAALRERYNDTDSLGLLTWEPEQLHRLIESAHDAGWQIATHAIGDRAIEEVVTGYERAQRKTPRLNARHRIEHCTLAEQPLIDRIASLGLLSILQPEDISALGDAYPPALGDDRARNNSPVGWFCQANAHVAFSSDRPVTAGHPLSTIRAAVERRTDTGVCLGDEHRVTAARAIEFHTAGGAYASFSEEFRGRLQAGMRADFVVLDRDITAVDPAEIESAIVRATVVDGQTVFEH